MLADLAGRCCKRVETIKTINRMMYYKYMVKVAKRIWLWLKAHRKTSNACKVLVNKVEDCAAMKKNRSKELDETKAMPTDEQIGGLITQRWDLRYNVLDRTVEIREKNTGREAAFRPLTKRRANDIVMRVKEVYPLCFPSAVSRYVNSSQVVEYNPIADFLDGLPVWDGTDRLTALARRVSDNPLWIKVFGVWMRGMVMGWLSGFGRVAPTVNQMAPILVSTRQGLGKSTFCRNLLPPELRAFYTDKFDLTSDAHAERKLGRLALVNMDEFDRYSERQMGTLKNLIQMATVKEQVPYSRAMVEVVRLCSFIATSNYTELLTDPTGSRRFFCVEVKDCISRESIDYEGLYAQLVAEIEMGLPVFFNKEEEKEIERNNRTFYRHSPVQEAFLEKFYVAEDVSAEGVEWLSATAIFEEMGQHKRLSAEGITIRKLCATLTLLHASRRHTRYGNLFAVVRR